MSQFTVDTHLFRELGELLVGRDSTALVELVKNAYDADSTEVTIHAEGLANPDRGFILVRDNGFGMTRQQFEEGFLRIASRIKEQGARLSPRFGRRYTGAKGIGRLAAHKLASLLEIHSVATNPMDGSPIEAFRAAIDWDKVEQATILDQVSEDAVRLDPFKPSRTAPGGTVLTLRRLRRRWTEQERTRFISEARSMQPPNFLTDRIAYRLLSNTLLFDEVARYSGKGAGDWSLQLTGDFDVGDEYDEPIADAAAWVLEVDARADFPRFGIAPTVQYAASHPNATAVVRSLEQASPLGYPRFQARALIREGRDWTAGARSITQWRNSANGIRIYLEGFRVLPYAERGNDWLDMDRIYAARARKRDPLIAGLFDERDDLNADEGLLNLPSRSYIGGAFLTLTEAGGLKLLVNREGFIPDAHFLHVQAILKKAVAFATRVRSAASATQREHRRKSRIESAAKKYEALQRTPTQQFEEVARSGAELLREAQTALASGAREIASERVAAAEKILETAPDAARDMRDREAMVHVLASLGTQTAAFVHELEGILGLAEAVERSLSKLADELPVTPGPLRKQLARTIAAVGELRLSLERQASYLTDVSSANARRRRSRQPIGERFASAVNLVVHHAERRRIQIENGIPAELRSPPMFRAELTAIFANLLTNAIKAAGEGGTIWASGRHTDNRHTVVRVENTGMAVDPADGEEWFRAFTSSTADVDPGLGKGMGLGLPITRRMLDEYGGEIQFAAPSPGFATCLEMIFPE